MTAFEQHNLEIKANAGCWEKKPLLQDIYDSFYGRIAAELPEATLGPVVEIGSGLGKIKRRLPGCITTDVFKNPWLDRVEDVYALTFEDASVGAFILFDVFHHLEYPGSALDELHRALRPQGRVVLFEPDMSFLGRFIYGAFHHEPLGLREPIKWKDSRGLRAAQHGYHAAQGNAYRIFVKGERRDSLDRWLIRRVQRLPALGYVASGGFRGPQLYPRKLLPLLSWIDRLASPLAALCSTRLLVVLEKYPR